MNWIIPALLAPAIYTIVNFTDKYVVSKEVKDYRGMPIYGTIMGFIVGTLFWVGTGFPILSLKDALIVFSTGMLTIWGAALYFRAISMEDASKLILLFQSTPVFTLILALLLLGERISLLQLAGFVLILVAVFSVSIERGGTKLHISKAFWLIIAVNLMWGLGGVLIKFAIGANSFTKILSYESWGLGLGGAILYLAFPGIRRAFNESIRTVRRKALIIMFSNELVFVIAKSITFFAYSIGAAALVSVVGSTQVFFGLAFGYLLTMFFPRLIKENISNSELSKKGIAAIVLFVGLVLVYI